MTLDDKKDPIETDIESESSRDSASSDKPKLVNVDDLRDDDQEDTCLRPLGLCELGGACDTCWYGPNSPRKKSKDR